MYNLHLYLSCVKILIYCNYFERGEIGMEINVNENNIDQALRILKKKMQREGVYRDMKIHRRYEKPSEKRKRKRTEALRRSRKVNRRRSETIFM